jgi:hypothetical protein
MVSHFRRFIAVVFSIGSLSASIAVSQSSGSFQAQAEKFESTGGRTVLVGYAFRKDQPKIASQIQIYVDKKRGSGGRLVATVRANLSRPDVRSAFRLTTDRIGFRWTIPTDLEGSGRKIFVYRANSSELIRSPLAAADGSLTLMRRADSEGLMETIASDGGQQVVRGWAFLPGVAPAQVRIDLYADDVPARFGVFVASSYSSVSRPEIASRFGVSDDRLGFAIPLPPAFLNSGRKLYAYAVPPKGASVPLRTSAGGANPLTVPFDAKLAEATDDWRPLSWSPRFASPRRVRATSQPPWIQPDTLIDETGGSRGTNAFWLVSTSMETDRLTPVRPGRFMDALRPDDPIFRVSAAPWGLDRYVMRLVLDKRSGMTSDGIASDATFTFGSVIDSFDLNAPDGKKPSVGDNLYVDITYRANRMDSIQGAGSDPPRIRFTVGITSRYSGTASGLQSDETIYTEVNLERTSSYDLCPTNGSAYRHLLLPPGVSRTNPDPEGIYDVRHTWGGKQDRLGSRITGGELAYYDRKAISQWVTETQLTDGWKRLRIPASFLIARHGWARGPQNWNRVEVAGIYLGMEMWGRGLLDVEIRDYQAVSARR